MCVGLLSVLTEYCHYDSNRVIIGIIIITLSFAGFNDFYIQSQVISVVATTRRPSQV